MHIIHDNRISLKAKGILFYMMNLPKDSKININEIKNNCLEGKESINNGLKELKYFGYFKSERVRTNDGTFEYINYISVNPDPNLPGKIKEDG